MARVALTGGTGLVGPFLIAALRARGHEVRALVRPRAEGLPDASPGVTWIEGRLDEAAALDALVEDADAILHAAYLHPEASPDPAVSDVEFWVRTNYLGTLRLLERTARTRAHQMIYVSSLHVYGHAPDEDPLGERFPRDEDFPTWPRDFYGAQRVGMEAAVLAAAHAFRWNASVFRLGWVFGRRRSWANQPLGDLIDQILAHGEVRHPHAGCAIAVEDAAEILADAVGDASLRGRRFNTFERFFDVTEATPLVARALGRAHVPVVCEPARPPRSPILGEAIRGRYAGWRLDACLERLVPELVRWRSEHRDGA